VQPALHIMAVPRNGTTPLRSQYAPFYMALDYPPDTGHQPSFMQHTFTTIACIPPQR
jgi:hypothetical protein